MERKEMIYEFIKDDGYQPLKSREMANLFCVPKKERRLFHDLLDELVAEGRVVVDERGRYRLPEENIHTGVYMATSRGFGFVRTGESETDVFVPEPYCGSAFDGDTVMVQIYKGTGGPGRRREGKIIKIVERANKTVVGTFMRNGQFGFVVADREKFTSDVYIPKGKTMDAASGHKVVVEIDDFGDGKKSPEGKVIEILGHVNDPGVDILSIIRSFGLPEEFPEEVMRQVKGIPGQVSPDDIGGRMDFRSFPTVTIDGEDAKDLDDAITLSKKEDGGYELGVHIADVSHYVTEGSPLDKEALRRGTSVYLADRVIPMLPHKLSNGICSLNEGEDRLALSCVISYDANGKIRDTSIGESVIRVDRRMSYTDVNAIVARHDAVTSEKYQAFVPMFEQMEELAMMLRKIRKKQGSIDFDFPECKIKLDEQGHPLDIVPYDRNVATKMIEEFMLAANKVVAEEYFWQELPFVYRTHEYPDMEKIKELAALARSFSHLLKVGQEEVHPREIQKLIESIEGTEEEVFLSRLTLRAMKRAKYSTENDGHFGLATKFYCHFTSPIRRYPDLQIHRIIKESVRNGMSQKRREHYEGLLPQVAKASSDLERRADDAEREVDKLKKAEYMASKLGEEFDGIVSGVTGWGIYVELGNTVEGMIRLADMEDDSYDYDSENYRVIGKYSGREYRLGQKLRVQVANADPITRTVDFVIPQQDETAAQAAE